MPVLPSTRPRNYPRQLRQKITEQRAQYQRPEQPVTIMEERIEQVDDETGTKVYFIARTNPKTGDVELKPDWDRIPPAERKYYPGAQEYFKTVDTSAIVTDKEVEEMTNNYFNPLYIDQTFKERVAKKALYPKGAFSSASRAEIKQAVREVLIEDRTKENAVEEYYETIHPVEKAVYNFNQSFRDTVAGVVTFPTTIAGAALGFAGQEESKEFVETPQRMYGEYRSKQPYGSPGAIRGLTTAALGTEEEKERMSEQMRKDPWYMPLVSTAGEVGALWWSSYATGQVKTGITRATGKVVKPVMTKFPKVEATVEKVKYYSPKQVLKRKYYDWRGIRQATPEEYLGKQTPEGFVRSTPKKTMRAFQEQEGRFVHATGYRMKKTGKIGAGERPGEMPGLSVSPKGMGQERFLRLKTDWKPSYSDSKVSIFPKMKRPTIKTGTYEFAELPKSLRYDTAGATKFASQYPEKGFIATKHYMGGFEPEAKIAPGVIYDTPAIESYFIKKGQVVAVDTMKLTPNAERFSMGFRPTIKSTTKPLKTASKNTPIKSELIKQYKSDLGAIKTQLSNESSMLKNSIKFEAEYMGKPSKSSIKLYNKRVTKLNTEITNLQTKIDYLESGGTILPVSKKPIEKAFEKAFTYSSGSKPVSISGMSIKSAISYPKSYVSKKSISIPSSYTSSKSSISTPSIVSEPSYPSYPSYSTKPSKPSKPYYSNSLLTGTTKSKGKKQQGYDVYVRSSDKPNSKYIRTNTSSLPKNQALGMGAEIVDTTISRSFKIKKSKQPPTDKPYYSNQWNKRKSKFCDPKNGVRVEKKKFRMDMPGEKSGSLPQGQQKWGSKAKTSKSGYKLPMVKL